MTPPALRFGAVQAAGVRDADEARMLCRLGVDMVGIPLRLDVHAPDLDEAAAARVFTALAREFPAVLRVCITYATDPHEVRGLCAALGAQAVQLHAPMEPAALSRLAELAPDLLRIKSLVVRGPDPEPLLAEMGRLATLCHAFITDTFDPASGASGATGKPHDWAVSRRLAQASPRPLLLAGGLAPDNVEQAVARVRPFGVDAHTGLEGPDGAKDPERVAAFVRRARRAFSALGP